MTLTLDQFRACFPDIKEQKLTNLYTPLQAALAWYKIDTPMRIAAFLAQTAHESGHFSAMAENLNYSAEGLLKTFPKYFNATQAAQYAHKPMAIANRVYAGRMGNGNEASGDGFRYRGKGFIQITGKANTEAFAEAVGRTLEDALSYLSTTPGCWESAAWFWKKHGLNELADQNMITNISKVINVGHYEGVPDSSVKGLAERKVIYFRIRDLLNAG